MFKISDHIRSELEGSDILIARLEMSEREKIFNLVLKKYINIDKKGKWIWEKFAQCVTLDDEQAWSFIKDFIKDNKCIMFFNQDEDKEMFYIKSGSDLDYILSETYGYEFYITDKECSYLLCYNHHNILYGCGSAEAWVSSLKKI